MASLTSDTSLQDELNGSKGYPADIFDPAVVTFKFTCWCCKLILRNPVQCYCGHRVCKECMMSLLRSSEDTPVVCSSCVDEDSVGDESYLREDGTFPDNAIRREMSNLQVHCSFTGCTWTGTFRDYERHYDKCEFFPVKCDVCGEMISKQELASHKDALHATSGVRQCQFGCEKQVDLADINNHLREDLVSHLGALHRRVTLLENPVGLTGNQNVEGRITDIERRQRAFEEDVNQKIAAATAKQSKKDSSSFSAVGGAASSGDVGDFVTVCEGVITVLNREMEKLTTQVDAAEQRNRQERELLDSFDRKIRSIERALAVRDATIADLELKIAALENTSYDGTLLWPINDFQRRRQDAISGKATSIYSPPFFTSRNGYKMCARLYLNGDGMGKGTHISLFFVVMRGVYDALLKWPFRQKVTLMILDQNGRENMTDAFRPDPASSSFRRPTTEMNIASGCPLLLPLSSLDSSSHGYVKDNTAFIKIIVNCEEINN